MNGCSIASRMRARHQTDKKITTLTCDDCRRCNVTYHLLTHQMMHFAGCDATLQLEPVKHVPQLPINFSRLQSFIEELETKESCWSAWKLLKVKLPGPLYEVTSSHSFKSNTYSFDTFDTFNTFETQQSKRISHRLCCCFLPSLPRNSSFSLVLAWLKA